MLVIGCHHAAIFWFVCFWYPRLVAKASSKSDDEAIEFGAIAIFRDAMATEFVSRERVKRTFEPIQLLKCWYSATTKRLEDGARPSNEIGDLFVFHILIVAEYRAEINCTHVYNSPFFGLL